ncbi:hypothetical protein B0H34DRAFT_808301 [Crassisporium funariophilum]|nr:hypothetical protein B0H34DRAFT_808301 [Crassisporium funariophilum]
MCLRSAAAASCRICSSTLNVPSAPLPLSVFCAGVNCLSIQRINTRWANDVNRPFIINLPIKSTRPPIKVESLCVSWDDEAENAKQWLLDGGLDISELKQLSLMFREAYSAFTQVENIIKLCAATLVELHLEPHGSLSSSAVPGRLSQPFLEPFKMAKLTHLRVLQIGFSGKREKQVGIPWLIVDQHFNKPAGWVDLSSILSTNFPQLRIVRFAVYMTVGYERLPKEDFIKILKSYTGGLGTTHLVELAALPISCWHGPLRGFFPNPWPPTSRTLFSLKNCDFCDICSSCLHTLL